MATVPGLQTSVNAPAQAVSESRVDRDSHFNGLFETKQNLRIEGVAEGEIQCEGMVTVAEGARVKAKVTASTVTIAGELSGEVVCRDVFQILPTGQVEATVSARRLIVQEGGYYNGEFHMITDPTAFNPASAAPAFDRRPSAAPKASEPASDQALSSDDWWSKLSGETSGTKEGDHDQASSDPSDSSKNRNRTR